jgi:hypothetical protein
MLIGIEDFAENNKYVWLIDGDVFERYLLDGSAYAFGPLSQLRALPAMRRLTEDELRRFRSQMPENSGLREMTVSGFSGRS